MDLKAKLTNPPKHAPQHTTGSGRKATNRVGVWNRQALGSTDGSIGATKRNKRTKQTSSVHSFRSGCAGSVQFVSFCRRCSETKNHRPAVALGFSLSLSCCSPCSPAQNVVPGYDNHVQIVGICIHTYIHRGSSSRPPFFYRTPFHVFGKTIKTNIKQVSWESQSLLILLFKRDVWYYHLVVGNRCTIRRQYPTRFLAQNIQRNYIGNNRKQPKF